MLKINNKFIFTVIGLLSLSIPAITYGGEVIARAYGSANIKDVIDIIPSEFSSIYPSSKYELFLWTTSTTTDTGYPLCQAIVGVVKKDSYEFPGHYYSISSIGQNKETLSNDKKVDWEIVCARDAVKNMVSDKLSVIYKANPTASKK